MKKISATMVEGQWVVMIESPEGDPVTMRDMTRFHRSLELKLRVYRMDERRKSLVKAQVAEIKQLAEVAAKKVNVSQEQKVTAQTTKGQSNG